MQDGVLVVPIDAVPAPPQLLMQKRLNFHNVPIGRQVQQMLHIPVHHSTGVDYVAYIDNANSQFSVDPANGSVQAGDSIALTVSFEAVTFGTSMATLTVQLQDTAGKAWQCQLAANCAPGVLRQAALQELQGTKEQLQATQHAAKVCRCGCATTFGGLLLVSKASACTSCIELPCLVCAMSLRVMRASSAQACLYAAVRSAA